MPAKTISYLEENENLLDVEIDIALSRTMEENMNAFLDHQNSLYAMLGDEASISDARTIYYLDES